MNTKKAITLLALICLAMPALADKEDKKMCKLPEGMTFDNGTLSLAPTTLTTNKTTLSLGAYIGEIAKLETRFRGIDATATTLTSRGFIQISPGSLAKVPNSLWLAVSELYINEKKGITLSCPNGIKVTEITKGIITAAECE